MADSEEKTAYWIRKKIDKRHYSYFCNHCGKKSRFYKSLYCGNCGFRMVDDVVLNEIGDVI